MTGRNKIALITGVTGQDGSYLAEFLLSKGYYVHGIKEEHLNLTHKELIIYRDIHEKDIKFYLHHADMTDGLSLYNIIQKIQPDEIYNLAAQSHVSVSFEQQNIRPILMDLVL